MKKILLYAIPAAVLLAGCAKKEEQKAERPQSPVVTAGGEQIWFPTPETAAFFATETVGNSALEAQIQAPAKVAAVTAASREGAGQNLVIFDDPELTSNYTQLLTHRQEIAQMQGILKQKQALIARKKSEVTRFEDLFKNGAGTGKDLADAQVDLLGAETDYALAVNQLSATRTAIIEHEARLKTAGFDPAGLRQSTHGKAIIICEVTESQISQIKEGGSCVVQFNAFAGKTFQGRIEDAADLIDQTSQMIKIRIGLDNRGQQFKAGMFATVGIGIRQGEHISIPKSSAVTVQGKSYVFVRDSATRFSRRPIVTGNEVGERFIVVSGLNPGEAVVNKGVLQLKGLSFGY